MDDKFDKSVPVVARVEKVPPIPIEFPPLTKKDLKEINELSLNLRNKFGRGIFSPKDHGFKEYTGMNRAMDFRDAYYNSMATWDQFCFALAMTRHPIIKEIAAENRSEVSKFDEKFLVENKIMVGMKMLDLGCGPKPLFARCCRAMGADVWTVDLIPALDFYFEESSLTQAQRDIEIQRHIQLNLEERRAVDIIREKSQGDFNLVSEANLDPSNFFRGRNIAWPLLKKGGVYDSNGGFSDYSPELKE